MIQYKLKKSIFLCLMAYDLHAYALPAGGPAESWTIAQISALTTHVGAAIAAFGTSFALVIQSSFERMISAVAVATKQEALNGTQISQAMVDHSSLLMQSVQQGQTQADVVEAMLNYSPNMGQGMDVCQALSERQKLTQALQQEEQARLQELNTLPIDNKMGQVVENVDTALAQRLANQQKDFCSEQDAKATGCKPSKYADLDTNPTMLFTSVEKGSMEDKARLAYIQHILGAPDGPPTHKDGVALQQAMLDKIEKDAFLSIPLNSLQTIRARHTKERGQDSIAEQLAKQTDQYLKNNTWAIGLSTQTKRGLLVETLKMQGLHSWMRTHMYEDQLRQEANLAALLLLAQKSPRHKVEQILPAINIGMVH